MDTDLITKTPILQSYTPCPEKGATLFLPVTPRMLTDFQNSFTVTLCSKFAVKKSINILP